jgi:hypothetical protein|tara:strand:- start:48 stop:398 length:351 start_codon:yes stop_codon:yes gene_type:complete
MPFESLIRAVMLELALVDVSRRTGLAMSSTVPTSASSEGVVGSPLPPLPSGEPASGLELSSPPQAVNISAKNIAHARARSFPDIIIFSSSRYSKGQFEAHSLLEMRKFKYFHKFDY